MNKDAIVQRIDALDRELAYLENREAKGQYIRQEEEDNFMTKVVVLAHDIINLQTEEIERLEAESQRLVDEVKRLGEEIEDRETYIAQLEDELRDSAGPMGHG